MDNVTDQQPNVQLAAETTKCFEGLIFGLRLRLGEKGADLDSFAFDGCPFGQIFYISCSEIPLSWNLALRDLDILHFHDCVWQ